MHISPTSQKLIEASKITMLMLSLLWTHLTVNTCNTEAFQVHYDVIMVMLGYVK